MPETIIESVLTGKLDNNLLLKWLNNDSSEDAPEDSVLYGCNKNEFVAFFLSYLRSQTSTILQTNNNALLPPLHQTPEKVHNSRRKHRRSISDPTSDDRKDTLQVKSQLQRSHESPSKDRKRTGRRVKTKLFPEDKNLSISSDESRLSLVMDRVALSSTPMKNGPKLSDYPNLASPVTPQRSFKDHERCDTPRFNQRHRSHEKSCLGDYLVNAQKSCVKKKTSKNASDDSETKIELDLSNSDIFPEIDARKSSSLRSERKRIKPTNIDKNISRKSLSLNSFNSDCFQQPSPMALEDNAIFKQQTLQPKECANTFEAERSMLKLERHNLMEKFNILNVSASPKPVTPQIKISQKESFEKVQSPVITDSSKIFFRDKVDFLVEIYKVLLNTNLILSVNTEIYFLISILLSNQFLDDYVAVESKLQENDMNFLLKSVHNCTYFAVKSLCNLKTILEVILDKNSLKILGENKKVRSFCPDLAKFLLNAYGLKCELENNQDKKNFNTTRSNVVICFNHETDNVDNFPSMLSFQNFKKQRDMFYEIVRWYQDSQSTACSRSTFRTRIKTLLSCGVSAANYAHLAALFTQHMLAECLPANTQESKLCKLQRRLTCPNAPESHRLPNFSTKESFYKKFILYTENESFRVHLRDALCSEITALDSIPFATEDRGNSNNSDTSKEYHGLVKKLSLLAKFLGFLTALPYTCTPETSSKAAVAKDVTNPYSAPKEKVLENNIALRNYIQPSIDLRGMLTTAYKTSRLIVTLPWVVHYLSMLDYSSLRTRYYQETLKTLHHIYVHRLKLTNGALKKRTVIFLKSVLGWLFDLPHLPQDLTSDSDTIALETNIDSYDLVEEAMLFDLCPYLRDVNVLLSTCRVNHEQKDMGSFRHITPVSLRLNPEDRIRNKEKELQARLEEEMLKSQPSSTRRVLEMVTERVAAATVRDLARHLSAARDRAMARVAAAVRDRGGVPLPTLLHSLQAIYSEHLKQLRSTALESSKASIKRRSGAALLALLPSAPPPLQALAVNHCLNRLNKWIDDHWNSTAILCKDIETEMKNFIALGDAFCSSPKPSVSSEMVMAPRADFEAKNISPTACIINLKEQICVLLDGDEPADLPSILASCAICCSPNNLFGRPPTQKAILQLSVDLCIVYVSRKPGDVTVEFLNNLQAVWSVCCPDRQRRKPGDSSHPDKRPENISPDFRNFVEEDRAPTPVSEDEGNIKVTNFKIAVTDNKSVPNEIKTEAKDKAAEAKDTERTTEEYTSEYLEFFDRVLCPRNIVLLSSSKCGQAEVWEALATVLVYLLKNDYLSEDSLTEQCLAVYRQDWPQNILENLSKCMKSVSSRWSRSSTGKFTLFLDFLAEYCGDMDYEPVD